MLCKGGMAMSEEKMGLKKGVFMAVLDTVTFGVPSYLGNLVKTPRKTIKLSLIIFPIVSTVTFLLSH